MSDHGTVTCTVRVQLAFYIHAHTRAYVQVVPHCSSQTSEVPTRWQKDAHVSQSARARAPRLGRPGPPPFEMYMSVHCRGLRRKSKRVCSQDNHACRSSYGYIVVPRRQPNHTTLHSHMSPSSRTPHTQDCGTLAGGEGCDTTRLDRT